MTFIGIDLGTSFIKGAVLDLERLQLRHIQRVPFPAPLPGLPPLYREYDPGQIVAATRDLLASLLPHAPDCEGIVMCSQMHSLVFTTEQGEARSNVTNWLDQRVLEPHPSGQGSYFEVMKARLTAEQLRQLGHETRPGLPVGVLFWLAEQGRLPAGGPIAAALPDFLVARLCAAPPCSEPTNAMAQGMLNLETLDWHREVLAALGLARVRLPPVRPAGEVCGYLALGSRRVPWYTPVGDYQCSLVGALLREGELSLNISTGSQVSLLRSRPEFGNFQTRPFFDGKYLSGVTHIPAGRALNALVRLLTELATAQGFTLADPWSYIARAAAEAGPSALRVNLAFFTSACGDEGEIAHIREDELTVGHLFRAAFRNMADNYLACALRVSPQRDWHSLVFSGGLAQRFDLLRAMICERFGVPYRMCPTTEDALLGLLALALAFTGRMPSVEAAMAHLAAHYETQMDTD